MLQSANTSKLTNRFFYILLFAHLIPLFFGKYFPTQDGPSHLKNALILKDMILDPQSQFHHFFDINANPNPNWFVHVFYAVFLEVLPAFMVEKLFLVLYVILLPLLFRYLIRQINPENTFISLLIFPFIYNITLFLGFFNFCFSLILFFYTLGFWLKKDGVFRFPGLMLFMLLVSLTYFSHPVSFIILAAILGFLWIGMVYNDLKNDRKFKLMAVKRLSGLVLGFLPMIIFFLFFLRKTTQETIFPNRSLKTYIPQFFQNYVLSWFGQTELVLNSILICGLLMLLLYTLRQKIRTRGFRKFDMVLVFFTILTVLTYFSPESFAGGSVILIRLVLYSNIILIICLSNTQYPTRISQSLGILFFIFSLSFLGFRSFKFFEIQNQLSDILKVEKDIKECKTLLPFLITNNENPDEPKDTIRDIDINVFEHVSSYLSIDKKLNCLENYEAKSGYFPIRWIESKYPNYNFPESGKTLSDSMLIDYHYKSGLWPDYILLMKDDYIPDTIEKTFYDISNHYKKIDSTLNSRVILFQLKDQKQ